MLLEVVLEARSGAWGPTASGVFHRLGGRRLLQQLRQQLALLLQRHRPRAVLRRVCRVMAGGHGRTPVLAGMRAREHVRVCECVFSCSHLRVCA